MGESLPARGVWIEITSKWADCVQWVSRSPQGECGLKLVPGIVPRYPQTSLPARGVWIEIGADARHSRRGCMSLPARGVWIEMQLRRMITNLIILSLPARGVWIEIPMTLQETHGLTSLPARGVWIEIHCPTLTMATPRVAPRKGSVD